MPATKQSANINPLRPRIIILIVALISSRLSRYTLALKRAEIHIYISSVLNITKDAGEIFQMPSHLSPKELRQAAERAFETGDHMTAMDLFGEAAEQAWDQGMTALASVCALRVNDVVAQIAGIERIQLPTYIDKKL